MLVCDVSVVFQWTERLGVFHWNGMFWMVHLTT